MFRQDALAWGRYRRVPAQWETEFGRWVADFGVPRVVKALAHDPDLRFTNQAVYEWLQGHPSRPARAIALVELSGGRLTLEAIYEHGREIRRSPSAAAPKSDIGRHTSHENRPADRLHSANLLPSEQPTSARLRRRQCVPRTRGRCL